MSVRRLFASLAIAAAIAPAALADPPLKVFVDKTMKLALPSPAGSVIMGNATVADVTIFDANTLLITGKAFGTTNMMILDRSGKQMMDTQLIVGEDNPGQLTIVRGQNTFSYSCADKCRSTPMVGDDPGYFNQVMQTVQAKAAAAKGQ